MAFDLARFAQAEFTPRTQAVPVPGLSAFFGKGDKPEWVVRSLTSAQLHNAIEAKQRQAGVQTVVDAIASSSEKAAEIKKALGLSADQPGEIIKRLEMLVAGSVSPVVDMPTAVKLAQTFPIEFLSITSTIAELTGQGFDLVKPPAASRKTPASTPK
jgi:hypothetical protein